MKLVPIPKDKYNEYRLDLMFDCYKWDPQFCDNNTVAKYALVLSNKEHEELKLFTEKLIKETVEAENFLNKNLSCAKKLEFPKKIRKEIKNMKNYDSKKHVRLMRFDFHPTVDGTWAVTEVNSDVPGGFAEATLMNKKALETLNDENYFIISFGDILIDAIRSKVRENGKIMLVHCTSYSDDRQVMQFLGDRLNQIGYEAIYAAADQVGFEKNKAISLLNNRKSDVGAISLLNNPKNKVDAIIRFSPLEWVTEMVTTDWHGYFSTETLSCNHPIAIFAQTKRFPFVWDLLESKGIDLSTWKKLLPETLNVKDKRVNDEYIFKPVYGRVGEKISIKEACKGDEYKKILKDVKKHPKRYLAQKNFHSKPIVAEDGESFHVCVGSYGVENKHAGYYARISKTPRIDSYAADIPVLIEQGGTANGE